MAGHKRLTFHSDARERMFRGATQLAEAVRLTLGPKSKSVLIQRAWGTPLVCNDGVTIARELRLSDPEEDLGAQMLRQAAERTGEVVGDGTSTATIIAHTILAEGLRNIAAGASAVDLKRGLDRGLAAACAELRTLSRPVKTRLEKAQVATISAHNDRTIGDLVADALERVGGEGVITVEESKTTETVLEVVEGMQLDRGYVSPYFVTDADKMQVRLEDARVLLVDRKIGAIKDLLGLLEQLAKIGRPLFIVAEDIEAEALATLVVNHMRGVLRCAAIKAPGFGDRRKAILEDIAILTGGRVVSEELGRRLETIGLDELGRAERVIVERDRTTLVGGLGPRGAIEARATQLRHEIERATSDYDRQQLRDRLAKLAGGVAVIRVGAPTEGEMRVRKDALDDAISATKAAIAEGIVPGGGLAHLRLAPAVAREESKCSGDERTGVQILRRALESPARQIAENSAVDGGVVVHRLLESAGDIGFDAARQIYVDMFEAGIVDPTKVVRIGMENAISVASTLLLTEALLTEVPEPRPHAGERGEVE